MIDILNRSLLFLKMPFKESQGENSKTFTKKTFSKRAFFKKIFTPIFHLFLRFRYPCSMPEDIGNDIGLDLSNFITFEDLIKKLTCPDCRPSKLTRLMPRAEAEKIFKLALRKEYFPQNSLFSYYFRGSWMEFSLHFDSEARLRRLYIRHRILEKNYEMAISP